MLFAILILSLFGFIAASCAYIEANDARHKVEQGFKELTQDMQEMIDSLKCEEEEEEDEVIF